MANNGNQKPSKKKKRSYSSITKKSNKICIQVDAETRHILNQMKRNAPPESKPTDSKMIRYCVKEIRKNRKRHIAMKLAEAEEKAKHWRKVAREIAEYEEDLRKA